MKNDLEIFSKTPDSKCTMGEEQEKLVLHDDFAAGWTANTWAKSAKRPSPKCRKQIKSKRGGIKTSFRASGTTGQRKRVSGAPCPPAHFRRRKSRFSGGLPRQLPILCGCGSYSQKIFAMQIFFGSPDELTDCFGCGGVCLSRRPRREAPRVTRAAQPPRQRSRRLVQDCHIFLWTVFK